MKKDLFFNSTTIFFATISLFFLRPMFLGYIYTGIGLIMLVITTAIGFFFTSNTTGKKESTNSKDVFLLCLKFYLPVIFLELLTQQLEFALGGFVITICSLLCLKALFSLRYSSILMLNHLNNIFILVIISTLITSFYYFTTYQFNIERLKLLEIEVRSRKEVGNIVSIYFPFTPLYTFFTTAQFRFPRFNMFFMEAGMVPGFFSAITFILLKRKSTKNIILTFLLLVGSILTFSTSFAPSFFLPFTVYYLLNGKLTITKMLIVLVSLVCGYFAFLKIPYIGFEDKSTTHGASFEDRITWFAFSFENLLRYTRVFCSFFLIYKLGAHKKDKVLFYCYMAPIFFIGVVNFILFSPLFLVFCFLNISKDDLVKRFSTRNK